MKNEREVAGIRCGRVLEALPDYLEGELPPRRREAVEAHLAGCDVCERFGGEYASTVAALRRALAGRSVPDGDDEGEAAQGAASREPEAFVDAVLERVGDAGAS